jgi:hypothetical protein
VSFMNLSAIDAAMICRTIDIIRAISLTIGVRLCSYKNRSYLLHIIIVRVEIHRETGIYPVIFCVSSI